MEKLVQFGAGAIGRSFIGQLFARGGYEVVFVDVSRPIIEALNERRSYRVEIRDDPPGELLVQNVRAVDGNDREAVVRELSTARIAGTAVGANALRFIYPALAAGLLERRRLGVGPLDIILCENLHHAAAITREGLRAELPPQFPLDEYAGLVETSIGKMVPLMPESMRSQDPLLVCGEAYNTLIVDARAFKNPIPEIPGLAPRANMSAYVDRKLYIHNLGHAAVAYEAARRHPAITTIDRAVREADVRELAETAMRESAAALAKAYPEEFTMEDLENHIQDLLHRFANPALGDTVFRVGRDVRRKLGRHDRIIGAMLTDLAQGVEPTATAEVAAAALEFRTPGENGELDPSDHAFITEDSPKGLEHVLSHISGLDRAQPLDRKAWDLIQGAIGRGAL